MFELHYTPEVDPRKALEDLKKVISFEPSLTVFFVAGKQEKAEQLKLGGKTISVPVEGIITPEGVWSRGTLAFLTDSEISVNTFEGDPREVLKEMEESDKGDFNLLIYPLFLIKDFSTFLKLRINFLRVKSLERASEIFEEAIYPMNSILRPFRDSGKTALAMNVFPLEIGIGVPKIFLNGKSVGRSVIGISLKEKIECIFKDSFPERGNSFEETFEILSQELTNVKKVKVKKKGLAIKEIDGKSVRDFLRENRIFMRESLEEDLAGQKFFGASPYVICFISRETYGSSSLGLFDYELKFYPSLFDTDIFFDEAIFAGEFIRGGIKRLLETIERADLAFLDQNFMLMFEENVVELVERIDGYGVFTSHPSFTGKVERKLMSEVESRICINSGQTMAFLKFK